MSNQKKLTVSILGKNYSLVTDEGDDVIYQAAQLLDSLMRQAVSTAAPSAEVVKKTTFVALQLAVDLVKKQQELAVFTEKTDTLTSLLKETLAH